MKRISGIRDDEPLMLMVHAYEDQYSEEALEFARPELKVRGSLETPVSELR